MGWLLVIVTFISGNSLAPIVQTQLLTSKTACDVAAKAVMAQIDSTSETNITRGGLRNGVTPSGRTAATVSCNELK